MANHQYVITPWRTSAELIAVRNSLYQPQSPDERSNALMLIGAWKMRGNLPHAVESTGLLFEAIASHEDRIAAQHSAGNSRSHVDSFSTRATYTLALSRFVTGFADLGRHRAGPGQTMHEVARSINLPPHFVELRHEAAHEDMPTLGRLIKLTNEALTWLWESYWSALDQLDIDTDGDVLDRKRPASDTESSESFELETRTIIKQYRSRRLNILKSSKTDSQDDQDAVLTSDTCAERCGSSKRKWQQLSKVLWAMVVPSHVDNQALDQHMKGARLLWDEFLKSLASRSSKFLPSFIEYAIGAESISDPESGEEAYNPAIERWLERMLLSRSWKGVTTISDRSILDRAMETCCLNPTILAKRIGQTIMKENRLGLEFQARWQPAFDAILSNTDDDMDIEGRSEAVAIKSSVTPSQSEQLFAEQGPRGWRIDSEPWTPILIGQIPR